MGEKFVLENARQQGLALTFDDVRLKTGYSEVLPDNVDVSSMFSRNVPLKIPIVSAAMDTVTEYKMAIELAKLGGIGIIHRNLSVRTQTRHVAKVKHHLNAIIKRPRHVLEEDSVEGVLRKREEKGSQTFIFGRLNSRSPSKIF